MVGLIVAELCPSCYNLRQVSVYATDVERCFVFVAEMAKANVSKFIEGEADTVFAPFETIFEKVQRANKVGDLIAKGHWLGVELAQGSRFLYPAVRAAQVHKVAYFKFEARKAQSCLHCTLSGP